ncbi:BrnA antitoxin family protein, partial [Rhizobium leguminosarum]|uniref:BrnA antitoxin family protein n=1 Tax=Rhizobium leguminosarum TaxID=384 RepID=UPI002479C131
GQRRPTVRYPDLRPLNRSRRPSSLPRDHQEKKLGRVAVSIRLDPQVVDAFTAKDEGWQSRINETLRKAVGL